MFSRQRVLTNLAVGGWVAAIGATGLAVAAPLIVPPAGGGTDASSHETTLVYDNQNDRIVINAHIYLFIDAPAWLKTLGRSAEQAQRDRRAPLDDVGAIHRRSDGSVFELTLFYADKGLDAVMQGLEKTCTANGGRVDDKTGAATHSVYCLAPTK